MELFRVGEKRALGQSFLLPSIGRLSRGGPKPCLGLVSVRPLAGRQIDSPFLVSAHSTYFQKRQQLLRLTLATPTVIYHVAHIKHAHSTHSNLFITLGDNMATQAQIDAN